MRRATPCAARPNGCAPAPTPGSASPATPTNAARGNTTSPWARRAAAARQALIGFGIPAGRIDTVSYGKERPIDSGSGEEAWARNRNAHTVLIGLGER
nr:OmpA family protein [Phenylobacterium sp. J426]